MKKLISHAWIAGGLKEYGTDTGKITVTSEKEWGSTGFGSIWRLNAKDFAFSRDDERIAGGYEKAYSGSKESKEGRKGR